MEIGVRFSSLGVRHFAIFRHPFALIAVRLMESDFLSFFYFNFSSW
nr:MAG TPA: hypothetical protein [Caudoviricetes sp.]